MPLHAVKQHSRTMLVVDDDSLIRELCAEIFDRFRVVEATGGSEALRILENDDIDIILTDVKMPGISGMELLQKTKQERPDRPVILMTGDSDKALILAALKAGADDFINKPIDILQLTTTVERVLERQTLREELANLRHLDKLKSEFLGLVSHKLKTPTTTISLFIQNLAEGIETPNDENFRQIVNMVQGETVYLDKLIQDLLYFSEVTLQEQELTLEATHLDQIAEQVVRELQPLAQTRSQQIITRIEPTPALLLHPQRIYFAVRALLDNAIKFTGEQGTIHISCQQVAGKIQLSIHDDGIGIPAAETTKIFNKFYQVDPEQTGHVRGFGLGLYYARDFVRAMEGQILIASEPGRGTTATIEFPPPG